jgi:hypothetical protein
MRNFSPILFFLPACFGESLQEEKTSSNGAKVQVRVFTESLCPCAAQWVHDFQLHTLGAVGDLIEVERYLDGTAEEDGSVWVFHGEREYLSQKQEVCVQSLAEEQGEDGHLASLEWTACVNGSCAGPSGEWGLDYCDSQGDVASEGGLEKAEECAESLSLAWEDIDGCANSEEGDILHWESTIVGNDSDVVYGMQGLPVVWVDGEAISDFWDCDSFSTKQSGLIQAVCGSYAGDERPEACGADNY